ncbi:hypothetical protein HPB47_024036 [Ixodes persulcatus]|uniref:Uncharacterized protein n=1 Tax=Ixodes persulcatus TaxID=34615 RepID=A0AC60Q5P2_IXOPE|nr:hypothetical protein HPB47_024036 [Ixodes persulcatus]
MLVLELFITMGNQVVHDPTLISGDIVSSTLVSGATASQLLDVVMEAPIAPRVILMIGTNDLRGECDACSLISDLAIILGWLTLHAEKGGPPPGTLSTT